MHKCFAIMPFKKEFDDVYDCIKKVVHSSIPSKKIECFRLDELKSSSKISDDLIRSIQESIICIADLSLNNPNVMWEVGYAMALKKPLVLISQNLMELPFDLKDWRTLKYDRTSLSSTLCKDLPKVFTDTLGAYGVRRDLKTTTFPRTISQTIAVTGSMVCNPEKCKRRIEIILTPYLNTKTTWLCGSYGVVDECAIDFLAQNNQNIFVVGYNEFDLSSNALELLEKYNLNFVDAQKEQLPKGLDAPSNRDLLYLTKADLLVTFWDGQSTGTRNLINWYSSRNRDYIVGFI